jgi:hypothetical protein
LVAADKRHCLTYEQQQQQGWPYATTPVIVIRLFIHCYFVSRTVLDKKGTLSATLTLCSHIHAME